MSVVERRVRDARRDDAQVVLEGFHAVKHALRFGAELGTVWTPDTDALRRLVADLAPDLVERLPSVVELSGEVWDRMTDGGLPSPALAVCTRPAVTPTAVLADRDPAPLVLLEDPTHLGNLGAVVRVAAAAGAAGVLTTGRSDPWHPSAVRGAAGLQLAVPTARLDSLAPVLDGDHGRPLVCLDERGEPLAPRVVPPRAVLAFGTERHGLSPALRDAADLTIRIPMRPGVSSLNLATAVAVTLYTAS